MEKWNPHFLLAVMFYPIVLCLLVMRTLLSSNVGLTLWGRSIIYLILSRDQSEQEFARYDEGTSYTDDRALIINGDFSPILR